MFKIGDYVVYRREVCKISDIKKNFMLGKDYYTLESIIDTSLILNVPIDNESGLLRQIISYDEAEELIKILPSIEVIITDDKTIENEYKTLMNSNKLIDLIKIIKIAYKRNELREKNGKKISEKDDKYFEKAEEIFYHELSLALHMPYENVKEYIINKLRN